MAAWRGDRGGGVESCIGGHIVTLTVVLVQVRRTKARIKVPPGVGVVVVVVIVGLSGSRRVARSGVTYDMSVTLVTSHSSKNWLKADAA